MGLVALKLFKGRQPGVGVIQTDYHPDHDQIVIQVVQEGAAVGVRIQRPASSVNHQTGLGLGRVHFPQFFNANAVALCIAGFVQLEALGQFTAQVTTRTFGKNRVGR